MVHVGLDLSRTRLDVHVMDESGAPLAVTTAVPDGGGLAALAGRIGGVRRPGVRGDRVDERRPVRARPAGAGGLAGRDRRRAEGQGAGPAGLQDRQDRLLGAGRAVPPGPGAGDLAAHPDGARRAGTGPLAAAPGAPPHRAEEPDPRHPARVRPPVPGVGPVRRRRPGAAGPAGAARALGRRHRRRAASDRRARPRDRRVRARPAAGGRRSPRTCRC